MVAHPASDDLSLLLRRHADLEALDGDGDGGNFLSGWQCENPWIGEISKLVAEHSSDLDPRQYLYLSLDNQIKQGLLDFHRAIEGERIEEFLCGTGSSTIIFSFCALLTDMEIREVYYLPPLYFSFHFALRMFGIRARAVSGRHAFEEHFSMNLPDKNTVLILTDPIWYAGISLPSQIAEKIIEWQRKTSSLVFVDGSFQYTNWYGSTLELTSMLDPEFTIRLICPTKILAAHGYRFAYAAIPKRLYVRLSHIYANIYGSASGDSIGFGRIAMSMVSTGKIATSLMGLAATRHKKLRSSGKIFSTWQPNCGYFVFERIEDSRLDNILSMDGSFFEQKRYKDHRRINLLSPSIHLFD